MLHDISSLQNDGDSPLHRATRNGHNAVVAVLLSNGADVNKANNGGNSPLHIAADNGKDAVVALLLSNGANVNQANNDGDSPLHLAARWDNYLALFFRLLTTFLGFFFNTREIIRISATNNN